MALRDLHLGRGRVLPARWLSVRFSRSGGPGGQHVNKVASKVDLRVDLTAAVEALGEVDVTRIRARLAARLDADGNLQVVCEEHRQQSRNVDAALERAEELLRAALVRERVRRKTKPTRGSRERRLQTKRQRGETKRGRRGRDADA